jgi:hypothetical protein
MSCREAVTVIPKLVDGTLDANATRALWAHLIECRGCMRLYEKEKAIHAQHPSGQSGLPLEPAIHVAQWETGRGARKVSFFSPTVIARAQ